MKGRLTRGQLADATGTGIEALRFYDNKGLLAAPPRGSSGYRLYPESTVKRVRFIRHAKELGFTLTETGELLALRVHPRSNCETVQIHANEKIEDVDEFVCKMI